MKEEIAIMRRFMGEIELKIDRLSVSGLEVHEPEAKAQEDARRLEFSNVRWVIQSVPIVIGNNE